ncbi:MAG TPA: hypothetical protein VGJ91_20620, partial [Polyangiaceae bacterium]
MNARATRSLLLIVPLMGLYSFACSSSEPNSGLVAQDGQVGALGLALQVAGTTLSAISYQITGPQGFSRSGAIDVSLSTSVSARIGGLPAEAGYSIALSGVSSDAAVSCSGSASFDVIAGQTAPVSVALACKEAPRSGSALLNGVLNSCPVIDGITALPAAVIVGGSLALTAAAHDSDAGPAALSYRWSAPSGS